MDRKMGVLFQTFSKCLMPKTKEQLYLHHLTVLKELKESSVALPHSLIFTKVDLYSLSVAQHGIF